jgi:RimJ/RimL family protein N-acetyltransferase
VTRLASTRAVLEQVRVVLADGGTVLLRPLRHGEVEPVLEVFGGLSELSRARRFLTGMPRLPAMVLAALTDVDGCDHVAWVATVDGCAVGIGRYARTDPETVEIALEVVDAHQGRGLGWVLADAVATVACSQGATRVTATVAPDNAPSLRVLRGLGLATRFDDGLLEGTGRLRLPEPARVRRPAVLARARRETYPSLPDTSCA